MPRRPDEPVFNRPMVERTLLGGVWMALLCFTAYVLMLASDALRSWMPATA